MQFRKYRKFAAISIVLAFLLPALVTATVVISYTYPTSTSNVTPQIYLTTGPEYTTANDMGLISTTLSTGTPYNISSGTTIQINFTAGAAQEALLNVLEIVNATSGTTNKEVSVYIEASLHSGITMYASTSLLTYNVVASGITVSGTPISSSSYTPVVAAGTTWSTIYLGFLNSNDATGTGTIYIYYTVT